MRQMSVQRKQFHDTFQCQRFEFERNNQGSLPVVLSAAAVVVAFSVVVSSDFTAR